MKKIIIPAALLGTALLITTLPTQSYADGKSRAHTHNEEIEDIGITIKSAEEFIEETEEKQETATERRKRRREEVRARTKSAKEYRRDRKHRSEKQHSH